MEKIIKKKNKIYLKSKFWKVRNLLFLADEALCALDTKSDFIALGREIIVDPDWIEKIQEEKESEIVRTIREKSQKELIIADKLFFTVLDYTR